MQTMFWTAVNLMGFFILVLMFINTDREGGDGELDRRLLRYMQIVVMVYLLSDTASYLLNGVPSKAAAAANYAVTIVYYLVSPLPGLIYLIVCDHKIFGDEAGLRSRVPLYALPAAFCSVFTLTTPLTRMIFYIDADYMYTRGSFLWIILTASFGYVLATYPLLALKTRGKRALAPKGFDAFYYLFQLPPSAAAVVQIINYGPLLIGLGYVVSTFIMFINVQTREQRRLLAARFRNINILQFGVVSFVMCAGILLALGGIADRVSRDYAAYRASDAASTFGVYMNKELGVLGAAAKSVTITEWLSDEEDPEKQSAAFEELNVVLRLLYGKNVFVVAGGSGREYALDFSSGPGYLESHATVSRINPDDWWYYDLLGAPVEYKLNIDIDKGQTVTKVWLNHKVTNENGAIGAIATGMALTEVAERALSLYDNAKTRTFIIDVNGVVCMDSEHFGGENYFVYQSYKRIWDVITDAGFTAAIKSYLSGITGYFDELEKISSVIELNSGKYAYATVAPIGATDWSVVTLFDPSALFEPSMLMIPFAITAALFIAFAFSSNYMMRRMFFAPLTKLIDSLLHRTGNGVHAVYGTGRGDEIGMLSNTIADLEDGLIASKERAEHLSRVKSEFLSRVSHEMRTPMNAIIGMTQLISMQGVPEYMKANLETIGEASRSLLAMIDDLLDVSGMEYETFKLNEAAFTTGVMFNDVLRTAEHNAAKKNQALSVRIDAAIPAVLVGDEKRLRQVVVCLIANAIKFTPERGRIKFSARAVKIDGDAATLRIEVADNGIGISEEQQKTIFDIFEQGDGGASRRHGGIGIGLALCRRIIEMMDGRLEVESKPGDGAKFFFTCKLKTVRADKI